MGQCSNDNDNDVIVVDDDDKMAWTGRPNSKYIPNGSSIIDQLCEWVGWVNHICIILFMLKL